MVHDAAVTCFILAPLLIGLGNLRSAASSPQRNNEGEQPAQITLVSVAIFVLDVKKPVASRSRRRDSSRNRPHKGGAIRLAQDKPAHQGQEGIRGAVLTELRVADRRTLDRRVSGILKRARQRGQPRRRQRSGWGRSRRSSGSRAPWRVLIIRWTWRRRLIRVPSATTVAASAPTRHRGRWRNPRHRSATNHSVPVLTTARARWIGQTSGGRTRPSLATDRQKHGRRVEGLEVCPIVNDAGHRQSRVPKRPHQCKSTRPRRIDLNAPLKFQ